MSKYDIDIDALAEELLPIALRGNLLILLKAILSPVRWLYAEFSALKQSAEYDMQQTGQVCVLEKMLNTKMQGTDSTAITICDGIDFRDMLISYDGSIVEFVQTIEYNSGAAGILYDVTCQRTASNGFEVHINTSLLDAEVYTLQGGDEALKTYINKYKPAGRNYTIITE